ncbi:MAG: hypothetical protein E7666_08240, partial [Ruminococcaceae bacterium]|nr:hypothetical protein [Oscillospiraceae bacterium]
MKKRFFSLLFVVCITILALVGLTSCDEALPAAKPQKLSAPVVTLTGNVATWSADANADKFEISLDGDISYVESSVTSKILTEGQTFKIRAVGDGSSYSTSDWSNSVTYTTVTSDDTTTDDTTTDDTTNDDTTNDDTTTDDTTNDDTTTDDTTNDDTNNDDTNNDTNNETKEAVVIVDEELLRGELAAQNGKNGAKITVLAYIDNDTSAYFERLEVYDGQTLVLTDNEYEGFAEYYDLNSKTEYTVKIYYASEDHGYTGRVKEVSVTTPAYELPDVDAYESDNNVVVGKHAILGFKIEKYTDLKYYDVIVRGFTQNDAYFAPFIVEMLDDPTLLNRLQNDSDKHYMRPGGYVWEAQHYIGIYHNYLQAWEHKEHMGYSDDRWIEIASSEAQYIYELNADNGDLFVANDGDVVYNYYAVLRDYFAHEDVRFEIYLRFDLNDGAGIREINMYTAYPYFREVGDENYGFDIKIDETVKNGYVFTETDYDYKTLYVHKLALYKDGEFVCYVPFEANDIKSIDMEAWLDKWIEKLKCEVPDATAQEMIEKLGSEIIKEIFGELWFEEEMGNDIVVDENGMAGIVGGNKLGNQTERELLTALSSVDADTMLLLFKAQTQENKTLDAFIAESDNATIISVLNDFRDQIEITSQNAYAIYTAIDSVYGISDQLKRAYENCIREENANKEVADLIEAIPAISSKFIVGTDLAPAGDYELRVLYRSILEDYKQEDDIKGYSSHNIRIKMDLEAPENIRLEGRKILWDAVEGADEYKIYVNGEYRFTQREPYYDNYGEIQKGDKVEIVAVGYYAYDSEPSDEYTFIPPQLSKPTVTVSGGNVSWNAVEHATKYIYTVN